MPGFFYKMFFSLTLNFLAWRTIVKDLPTEADNKYKAKPKRNYPVCTKLRKQIMGFTLL